MWKGHLFNEKNTDHIRNENDLYVPYYTEVISNDAKEIFLFFYIWGARMLSIE